MASFEKRSIEENTYYPEVCGVDFRERIKQKLAQAAATGAELWTAWFTVNDDETGPGFTQQLTQENCRVFMSDVDDEADTISVLDPRDGQWFTYTRFTHPENFMAMAQVVLPWSVRVGSMVPLTEPYSYVLKQMSNDIPDGVDGLPDGWLDL